MIFSYPYVDFLALIILSLLIVPVVISDIKSQRISNKITFPAMLIGSAFQVWLKGFPGLIFSLQGIGLGIALFIIPYVIGKMGAGDAKLMGAVGAFLGPKDVIIAFVYIAIAGGIYSLLLILWHRQKFKGFFTELYVSFLVFLGTRKIDWDNSQAAGRPRLCYAVAIAVGTWLYIGLELFGVGQLVPL
jgi:prepilin peptidase CpaA